MYYYGSSKVFFYLIQLSSRSCMAIRNASIIEFPCSFATIDRVINHMYIKISFVKKHHQVLWKHLFCTQKINHLTYIRLPKSYYKFVSSRYYTDIHYYLILHNTIIRYEYTIFIRNIYTMILINWHQIRLINVRRFFNGLHMTF